MYVWNTAVVRVHLLRHRNNEAHSSLQPFRDGDLEAGIVVHELAHGLSTRLSGGPANSGCLGWGESGGMGEGWGGKLSVCEYDSIRLSSYQTGSRLLYAAPVLIRIILWVLGPLTKKRVFATIHIRL